MPPDMPLFLPISGGSIIGLLLALIKLWSDVQSLTKSAAGWEEACKKVAAHETEIALLKMAVSDLRTIPLKLDDLKNDIRDLVRSKV